MCGCYPWGCNEGATGFDTYVAFYDKRVRGLTRLS